MIDLGEAAEVWQVAHTIFLNNQNGKAQAINQNSGGCGDSNHHIIWVADVRKLVEGELNTFLLDCVYGDSNHNPDAKSRRGAKDVLRAFSYMLYDRPSIMADYNKMRKIVFD